MKCVLYRCYIIRTPKYKAGVTFIEMLLVVSLISVIGLTLYQSISNGVKIWEKSQRFIVDENVAIFFDKMIYDLRNALNYSLIAFEGRETRLAFAGIVTTAADKEGTVNQGYIHQIGRVEYFFDKAASRLSRRQANYSQATEGEFGLPRVLVDSLHSVKFSYHYGSAAQAETDVTSKADGMMPAAVKIDIEFLEETGKMRKMTGFIAVPVGI